MRAGLLAAVLAFCLAFAAIPALAGTAARNTPSESCTPPKVNGFTVTSVHQHGIGCDAARGHVVHTMRHGAPHGWQCTQRISGRNVNIACHNVAHPSHTYSASWHVH